MKAEEEKAVGQKRLLRRKKKKFVSKKKKKHERYARKPPGRTRCSVKERNEARGGDNWEELPSCPVEQSVEFRPIAELAGERGVNRGRGKIFVTDGRRYSWVEAQPRTHAPSGLARAGVGG